jgi:hypothetical protein
MQSEDLIKFTEDEKFNSLYEKLNETMTSSYIYSSTKTNILQIVADMVEIIYIKGRLDERYVNKGPQSFLYKKQ